MDRRDRYRTIVQLGTPIIGGMISQNVLNLVDTAMVGTLGDEALAAVGNGSFLNFMSMAFLMGFSAGVQAMVARRVGEGRSDITEPLNGAIALSAVLAIPVLLVAWSLAPWAFSVLNPDPEVGRIGVPYFRIRLCTVAFVGANFSFRGYWNGIKRPGVYMRTLMAMHVINIVGNWIFIFGHLGAPQMGASGAALASALATVVGTALYFVQGKALAPGFLSHWPTRSELAPLLKLSAPNGLQQLLFASGYTVLFGIIGRVGTAETAAANVLITLMLVCILPGMALGMAGASLVGQALGRGEPEDAQIWGWQFVHVGMVAMGVMGLPMLLFPEFVLHFFLHGRDTIDVARVPLQLMGGMVAIDAVGMVLSNALLGAGATRTVAKVIVGFQWLLFLPGAWLVGPVLGYGLVGIWAWQVGYRLLQAAVFARIWQRGAWRSVTV